LGEIVEDCGDNDDDDCDGVNDNGCGTANLGDDCYHDDDCASGSCTGAMINSLLGAAAVPGSSSLDDDIAGMCDAVCGDGNIDGSEQCDYGNAPANGDGCDIACQWESGTFDTEGFPEWTHVFGSFAELFHGVAIDSQDRVLAAGKAQTGASTGGWQIARLDSGAPDTSFHADGFAEEVVWENWHQEIAHCVKIQSDGKIVAAGDKGGANDTALARWNTDGTIDTTFGPHGTGQVYINFGGSDGVRDCELLGDDSIIVVGRTRSAGDSDMRITKFTADGIPDTAWANGQAGVSGIGWFDAVEPSLIADGETFTVGALTFEFEKTGGTVDIFTDISGAADAADVAATMDAVIQGQVAPGVEVFAVDTRVYITHAAAGTTTLTESVADAGFTAADATGGSVMLDISVDDTNNEGDMAWEVELDSSGNMLVAGTDGLDIVVARFLPTGALDVSFDTDGVAIVDVGAFDIAIDMVITSDDRPLIAGQDGAGNAVIALFTTAGGLDTGFDTDGLLVRASTRWEAITLDGDGNPVVGGTFGGSFATIVSRYDLTGAIDPGFGAAGDFIWDTTFSQTPKALEIDGMGRIVAVGDSSEISTNNPDMQVFRLAP
ncbi:MAG: hypothetical protein OXT09_25510, partial [Myxococcales bacterium]|nr:hypothetical protein [Myxococcales bacterium]